MSKIPAPLAPAKTDASKDALGLDTAPKPANEAKLAQKSKPASPVLSGSTTGSKTGSTPAAHPAPRHVAPSAQPLGAPAPNPAKPATAVKSDTPASPPRATPAPSPKKASRAASKYPAPQVQAPLPAPTSRFADRFAPPRPPTRQMNTLDFDAPRQAQKFDPKLANAWKTKTGRELTDAEVLAMPETEYMSVKQLEFFKFKLQTLKDDLLSNAGQTTEHLREDTSIVPDPADRATIEEEHALELRTRDRERKLLKKISQSMSRLDSGEYGFCDETGENIGLGRLIARPTATLSLEAQQRRELKQKMFGE